MDADPGIIERLDRIETELAATRRAAEDARRSSRILVVILVLLLIALFILPLLVNFLRSLSGAI